MGDDYSGATVLVVDDNEELADLFAVRLENEHETRVAYDGATALDSLDESVDVVLLDRRMPELSGDELLEHVEDTCPDCRVVLVTAVDPDFDIVEMPFDEYLHKPVRGDALEAAVERQLRLGSFDEPSGEYASLRAKLAAIEDTKSRVEIASDGRFAALKERAERLRDEVDPQVEQVCPS